MTLLLRRVSAGIEKINEELELLYKWLKINKHSLNIENNYVLRAKSLFIFERKCW